MKKSLLVLSGLVGMCLSATTFAAMPQGGSAGTGPGAGMMGQNHPCKAIMEACKNAGFVKGGATQGKGIWKDCVEPILAGKAVTGVNVSASEVQACAAKKAARDAQGGGMEGQGHGGNEGSQGGGQGMQSSGFQGMHSQAPAPTSPQQ